MVKKHIISLTGDIASGKGVTSKLLSNSLNYPIYKASAAIREFCRKENMTIVEFQDYVAKNPEIDRNIEKMMEKYAKENDNYIIEARTGWFTAPFSFKVYLTVDTNIAAKRIMNDDREAEEKYNSIKEAEESIKKRSEEEANRWKRLYNKDIKDRENFDLVLDTNNLTAEDTEKIVKEEYFKWLAK